MKNLLLVLFGVLFVVVLGTSAFAGSDLVKLRTIEGLFEYPKDDIINNPFAHDTMIEKALTLSMFDSRETDGSYYFKVSGTTLKVALFYFSRGSLDGADLNETPFLVEELDYLGLSDLAASLRSNRKAQLNMWACSGFCSADNNSPRPYAPETLAYGEVHSTGESIIEAWESLVFNCQKLSEPNNRIYITKRSSGNRADALSMLEACIHI